MGNAADTSPANETVLTAENAVAFLKEGGFLREEDEARATAFLKEQLATMQGATHMDLTAAARVEDEKKTLSPENRKFLENLIKPQIVNFIHDLSGIGLEFGTIHSVLSN